MRSRRKKRSNLIKKFRVIELSIFTFALMVFLALFDRAHKYAKPVDLAQLPLVKQVKKEFKFQPENSAGLVVMHQNKTIYDNLKSNPKKEIRNHAISPGENEDLLVLLRSTYLRKEIQIVESPFSMLDQDSDKNSLISFGTTSTKEAAEIKSRRLANSYQELFQIKFKIVQIDKDTYKLETAEAINEKVGSMVCQKIKSAGGECNVIRLPRD
ncbi:hypothetical protein MHYMCMPSP_00086 [Hyalomma marginatum]|uniref:Uncharacterized protein n=1 Tax=Hyalomma marginatum TaxID=34627 RepID=A0A8S4BW58_9ACAR|nr:hypothetical protein MHYMCMPSP_00086 [Hyalomma marginatum]CAG7598408.1 hypothetical protein MHYMCMPASI_01014 [Hyalomma marginatum]